MNPFVTVDQVKKYLSSDASLEFEVNNQNSVARRLVSFNYQLSCNQLTFMQPDPVGRFMKLS